MIIEVLKVTYTGEGEFYEKSVMLLVLTMVLMSTGLGYGQIDLSIVK